MEELERCVTAWKDRLTYVRRAIVCSPDIREVGLLQLKFPGIDIRSLERGGWNLDETAPVDSDIVLASHVFMCAADPRKWIDNVCRRARFFIMLDLAVGYRGGVEGELSPSTGDVMRYQKPPEMLAKFEHAYDLNLESGRLLDMRQFEYRSDCGVEGYDKAKLFIALFKGDL